MLSSIVAAFSKLVSAGTELFPPERARRMASRDFAVALIMVFPSTSTISFALLVTYRAEATAGNVKLTFTVIPGLCAPAKLSCLLRAVFRILKALSACPIFAKPMDFSILSRAMLSADSRRLSNWRSAIVSSTPAEASAAAVSGAERSCEI